MTRGSGRLGVVAAATVGLALAACASGSDSGPTDSAPAARTAYGIPSDSGSRGSLYSMLTGGNGGSRQAEPADAMKPPASASAVGPAPSNVAAASSPAAPAPASTVAAPADHS